MDIARKIIEMNKRLVIGLVALAVALALSVGATNGASANEPYVVTGEQVDVAGLNIRGTILEDVKMHQGTIWQKCQWVNGGYNSGRSVNGGLYWYHDPVKAKICRNQNSPTGWVKVAGGQTGRNCGNPYKPHGPPPGPVVQGPVVMVRDFSRINMNATARAQVSLREDIVCPDGSKLSASSTGLAVSKVRVNQQMLLSAQGNIDTLEAQLKNNARAKAIAQAQGKLEATCGTVEKEEPPAVVPAVAYEKPKPQPPAPKPKPQPVVKSTPEQLPNTGPGALAAAFIGVSSLASFAYTSVNHRLRR